MRGHADLLPPAPHASERVDFAFGAGLPGFGLGEIATAIVPSNGILLQQTTVLRTAVRN